MKNKTSIAVVAACSYLAWQPCSVSADEHDTLPAAIVCSIAGKQNFAFLTVIETDGTARYMTLTGTFAEVTPDKVVKRTQAQATGDCAGKTISELRNSGQTREFAQ